MLNLKKDLTVNLISVSYLEEQSEPWNNIYIWMYSTKIQNKTAITLRLVRKVWKIVDENGSATSVEDFSMETFPSIYSNELIQYTGALVMSSPSGILEGLYEFIDEKNGNIITTNIDCSSLDSPYTNKQAS